MKMRKKTGRGTEERELVFHSSSPGETRAVGALLGARLRPGAVLALHGELGAGKTCLVQGLAEGLGIVPPARVSSPTFVIINEYPARIPLFHFDLYRLPDGQELIELGWEDYLERRGVIAIEWAERMRDLLPADHLDVTLEVTGEKTRRITLRGRKINEFATEITEDTGNTTI